MAETLLTPSSIKLFGRIVPSLQYSDDTKTIGNNNFLQHQLSFAGDLTSHSTSGSIGAAPENRVVTLNLPLGAIISGMVVTGIVPRHAGPPIIPPRQAFLPGTHIVSVTKETQAIPAFPGNAAIAATATTPAYPAAHATAAVPAEPATFTVSADPLVAPATGVTITAWSLAVNIARIYAFSFEGAVYTLPRPSMFLVHGPGEMIDITGTGRSSRGERWSFGNIGRTDLDQSGVMAREWEFSAPSSQDKFDLRYWEYEKGDFLMRLDSEAGPLEQILLAAALRGGDMADRATGIRSGASLAGASLAGASLSGASLSGANLSGASLSGASLRNGR
jgi:hypothetical protein